MWGRNGARGEISLLTFPVGVDAELRVELLVSLLFPDPLDVNRVPMDQIQFIFICHVERKIKTRQLGLDQQKAFHWP